MSKRTTFTIKVNGRALLGLTHVSKGEANGAMNLASCWYAANYTFEMVNDHTGEVVQSQKPRRVHVN